MELDILKCIFEKFQHVSNFSAGIEIKSGHINDTYLIKTDNKPSYILQRINHLVFKDVPALIANKVLLSKHLEAKSNKKTKAGSEYQFLQLVQNKNGKYYHLDESNNYWNLMIYIENSQTFDIVPNAEVAYEAGKLFGDFLSLTADLKASKLNVVIPGFHDMNHRFEQFDMAFQKATTERRLKAKELTDKVLFRKDEMLILQQLKSTGKISNRVTHNDTKISNALFSMDNKAICVIDTDTVMPGILHYDFGDAIRTICNTAAEDEADLNKVNFNFEYYEAYKKGFLEHFSNSMTQTEIKYLPLSVKTMIFIIALRFLTDYLNDDIYFKTEYKHHNLVRAKNQFHLIESFERQN